MGFFFIKADCVFEERALVGLANAELSFLEAKALYMRRAWWQLPPRPFSQI
jgi:hypothetical protein